MNASTNVAKQLSPVAQLSNFMDKLKPQLALALPKHLTADRMARLALTAFSTTPKLQKCTTESIAASVMTAGQLGLEPGVNGAGFLIPYKDRCTFVPGWKGLVDLVARSGRGTVYTGVIYSDQRYTFKDGAQRDLIIHNETDLDDPSEITHAYAIGWVKDAAFPVIELWRVSKIRKHRDKYNKVGTDHYSFRDWEMYCRKVPLLQVLKYMPCSVEVANAIAVNDAVEAGHGVTIENGVIVEVDGNEVGGGEKKPEALSDETFKKEQVGWKKSIVAGRKTLDDLVNFVFAQGAFLTDEQKDVIRSWVQEPAKVDDPFVAEMEAAERKPGEE